MKTIYIVPIESVPTRYTCQWYNFVPNDLSQYLRNKSSDVVVKQIEVEMQSTGTTPGAFLDFAATNVFKSQQLIKIAEMFQNGVIQSGDQFVFTDAWNTSILQVKYMSELLDIPVKIHGLWHAGSYDPYDFLGRQIVDKSWSYYTERAIFHACDFNWFATDYHRKLFNEVVLENDSSLPQYGSLTGWPMSYLPDTLEPYRITEKKRNLIIFPHRVSDEKQPEIFRKIASQMPEYEFVICQDKELTKDEYHKLMASAKVLFSANLQETLGITSVFEGPLLDVLPLVPDRLSYTEIFKQYQEFVYDSDLTAGPDTSDEALQALISRIRFMVENYETLVPKVRDFASMAISRFGTADLLYQKIYGLSRNRQIDNSQQ